MANQESGSATRLEVPVKKQTTPGLYVTAQQAYEMWKADPATVNIIDVRTPEEYIFVGHAAMARNIPLLFIEYQWDTEKDEPKIRPNPDFGTAVKSRYASGRQAVLDVPLGRAKRTRRQRPSPSRLLERLQHRRRLRG